MKTNFTKEIVEQLNKRQQKEKYHPYTCDRSFFECETKHNHLKDGVLIATENGWICPCGKYKQNWY